ncbi:inosine-uridine preferring nucleoside hydrolase-like isoform X2 [Archocentrus centrarchus]|uniref:inosine-uridine preferring nucleoside hydrolase-like isoform X2 n=1 Tax=Archocentrus centrarchus TaxID=63155 RepID=UPI0011EA29BD|nr:inosine-uridine preferring nucleoside hydrolase-like isoform X2 [Archocentrus centrarchus]
MKKKLIIDVDAGVDDAVAIMIALSMPDVEVLGITCCNGNTSVENVLKNVLRVLKICNRLDIPVYRGCSKPLVARTIHASDYFGTDGFGDVPDPHAPSLDLVQKKKAEQAIIDFVNENPGEVMLVSTAPLTNLAVTVQLDPTLSKKLKALFIMGGNTESRGNTTMCGEFNFVADPEAAYIVLDRYTCPTYIATWEFTCRNSLPWKAQSPEFRDTNPLGCEFDLCDAYAMAAAVNADIDADINNFITESVEVAVTVELEGTYTRGMMVLDYMHKLKKEHTVFIMKKVDLEMFQEMLINAVK